MEFLSEHFDTVTLIVVVFAFGWTIQARVGKNTDSNERMVAAIDRLTEKIDESDRRTAKALEKTASLATKEHEAHLKAVHEGQVLMRESQKELLAAMDRDHRDMTLEIKDLTKEVTTTREIVARSEAKLDAHSDAERAK